MLIYPGLLFFCYTVPLPEIVRPLKNVTVTFQQTAILHCLALSYGSLTYDWRRFDGKGFSTASNKFYVRMKYSDTNKNTVTHQLMIPKVELSDEGWYCCVATNDNGHTEKCVWLEVDSKLNLKVIVALVKCAFIFSHSNYYWFTKIHYSQSWQ